LQKLGKIGKKPAKSGKNPLFCREKTKNSTFYFPAIKWGIVFLAKVFYGAEKHFQHPD
jgi:hypothetical protein